MITIAFVTASKRRNSTLIPDYMDAEYIDVTLKAATSEENPVFLLQRDTGDFPYNHCRWGSHYYWIDGVTYERNDLISVSCSLDVLATYRADILASTQFVAYSNVSGGTWLTDRRIPVMSNCVVGKSQVNVPNLWIGGNYVLTVLGESGCKSYLMSRTGLDSMLNTVQTQNDQYLRGAMSGFISGTTADDIPAALESMTEILTQTDLLGNAFQNAVACLRSCIWVPFASQNVGSAESVKLGNYNTGQLGAPLTNPIYAETLSASIPWRYTDWRRAYCEDIYLYLPLVGMVSIPTDQITNATAFSITISYCYTDGAVAYIVRAGDNVIGTYGGNCAAQYPLGINQQASAGQIANTLAAGISKTVGGLTLGNVPSLAAAGNAVVAAYETLDTAYSTSPSVIGGIGGGAGAKLPLDIICVSVSHDTVVEPSVMAATMGVPTQKPMQLSGCSGFVQCANAHVAAPAHGDILNQIDMFVNSGFYIE